MSSVEIVDSARDYRLMWIVNTFLDNFFKVSKSILFGG